MKLKNIIKKIEVKNNTDEKIIHQDNVQRCKSKLFTILRANQDTSHWNGTDQTKRMKKGSHFLI